MKIKVSGDSRTERLEFTKLADGLIMNYGRSLPF